MPSTLRARGARLLAALGLAGALLLPAGAPAVAADPLVLRAGTDQKLETLNPWASVTFADFEAFQLVYDMLVGWGQDLEPVPGFAESWQHSADSLTWTFKIRPGMTWSDGEPATCEDARWTYQTVLDAGAQELTLGNGYLEAYLNDAGLKAVSCTDPTTFVAELAFPNSLLLEAYVPILPAHIWSQYTLDQIGNLEADDYFKNEPPIVGTGPFKTVEWDPGKFIRFERNDSYWGTKSGLDGVLLQTFQSTDTMVQALKNGELDYVRGIQPDQFNALKSDPNIAVVEGVSNGYSYLSYNLYPNPIEGGGASTTALRDTAFRDALNWAIDEDVLVDRVLGGYGIPGDTNVPPFQVNWHVAPTNPRTFDIEEAKRRLDAAGYPLDAQGKRLDKDGKPITLRMTWPDSEAEMATVAEFITQWWGELGITVDAQVTEEDTLIAQLYLPEAGGKADWDTYLWGWGGDPDPTSLLRIFTTDQIGNLNDTGYSNAHYDELHLQQVSEQDTTKRKALIAEMQNIVYDDAPYDVLYYDSELHAYRTDKIGGWRNQPKDGTPLFEYGAINYTLLGPVAAASPSPAVSPSPGASAAASPSASPAPSDGTTTGGDNTLPIAAGLVVVAVVVIGGVLLLRRRSAGAAAEDDDE
jgi:peptide/nickel transport system substrate-binding protein